MTALAEQQNEYVDFWNDILVPKFTKYRHVLVDGLTHHSARVMPSLPVREGDRVVDVGCGFGDTAIQLAQRVGPTGEVVGIDCCEAFLASARAEAAAAGVTNTTFIAADVQTYPFQPEFDFCFSRFGTQFFENPVAGLKNMRRSLKPGGRMAMIVWRVIEDNPWLGLPKQIVSQYLPEPGENARSCGPGPFSMANPEVVSKQLEIAGFTDVTFERIDVPLVVGRTTEDAIGFQLALGPAGEVYREAGTIAEQRQGEIHEALARELGGYVTDEGVVMDSSSWTVSARNPG